MPTPVFVSESKQPVALFVSLTLWYLSRTLTSKVAVSFLLSEDLGKVIDIPPSLDYHHPG
eukprot:scaffold13100_cov108-Skeletonema_marinoi.AAC.3